MFVVSKGYQEKIDKKVTETKDGDLITFGDIAKEVFGKTACAPAVGSYISSQRGRDNYPWWRVVNSGWHPVADGTAISRLEEEGHTIINGIISKYK